MAATDTLPWAYWVAFCKCRIPSKSSWELLAYHGTYCKKLAAFYLALSELDKEKTDAAYHDLIDWLSKTEEVIGQFFDFYIFKPRKLDILKRIVEEWANEGTNQNTLQMRCMPHPYPMQTSNHRNHRNRKWYKIRYDDCKPWNAADSRLTWY